MQTSMNGKCFGHWTILSYAFTSKSGHRHMNCICDCGVTKVVRLSKLVSGESKSCGCKRREKFANGAYENGKRTRLYNSWLAMRARCMDVNNIGYKNYGGRGISVCDEWSDFRNFKKWAIENGYSDGLSLDRIDVNKGYCPLNCRWVDNIQQANNTRKNKYIYIDDSYMSISQAAKKLGVKYTNLYHSLQTKTGREGLASRLECSNVDGLIPRDYNWLKNHGILPLIEQNP